MKKICVLLMGWMAATLGWAEGERTFVLATAGEVEAAFAARVQAYLQDNCGYEVRLASPVRLASGQSLEGIGRSAAKTLGPADFAVVVLARASADQPQGVCLPDDHFGILNLTRLEAGVADAAQLERRAGQEGLRVMSMLLGMAPCPFPLCVLVGYEKVEDLDQLSGNFCPPCLDRFQRMAREAGLRPLAMPAAEIAPAGEAEPAAAPAPEEAVFD